LTIIEFPEFNRFDLKDKAFIQQFVDRFNPLSCEYNFSNLFCWQEPCNLSWTMYKGRLLIYDGIDKCSFMPIGDKFSPKELVDLSLGMKIIGLKPDLSLVAEDYIKEFPEIKEYYTVKIEPDYAEYIYKVDSLCDLKGKKLSKKRNLISQFKRLYPGFIIQSLSGGLKQESLLLAKEMLSQQEKRLNTLDQEFEALNTALNHFEELELEGLVLLLETKAEIRAAAFSIFSPFNQHNSLVYDIHFEKADRNFKGASQVINHETAKYLRQRCQYLNKEQDLGIKGLRQAKMSYDPEMLITPCTLILLPQK
jgi:hypothetical protein